ncbi:hypothetical protein [Rathayibacter sp. Leaf296]|uniref:hypothetical protein n=1 Tax=Rathayibacter sp. Leaf296 TaxID=1736327 RepID=UPI0012F94DD5|nr:hypothetical protein [Rathayibacter sp. Leaf296]
MTVMVAVVGGVSASPANAKPVSEKGLDDWQYSQPIQDFIKEVGPDYIDSMKRQGNLIDWIEEQDPDHRSGYLYVAEGAAPGSVDIAWSGESALRSQASIKAKELGLVPTFTERPFDWPTIDAQARAIMDRKREFAVDGFAINSIDALAPETTDLVVHGTFSSTAVSNSEHSSSATPEPAGIAADLQKKIALQVSTGMSELGPIPVRLSTGNLSEPTANRNDDTPSYWGGGFMRSWYPIRERSTFCSTGFAYNFSGTKRMTTARHCTPMISGGNWTTYDNDSQLYGGNSSSNRSPDYGALRLTAQLGAGRIFDGGPGSTSNGVPVKGHQSVGPGNQLCSEGANTGVICGIVVDKMMVLWDDGFGSFYNIQTRNTGTVVNAGGNSGGPLIAPWSNGFGAIGMIQYGNTDAACPTLQESFVNCYKVMGFTSAKSIGDVWGAALVTQ